MIAESVSSPTWDISHPELWWEEWQWLPHPDDHDQVTADDVREAAAGGRESDQDINNPDSDRMFLARGWTR